MTRRGFNQCASAALASAFAPAQAANRRLWIDSHIHVSDISREGHKRERMLEDLLELMERSDADLRFIISADFPYQTNMKTDPAAILAANRMIHDLCRRAPKRLFGSCTLNPNFLEESLRVMKICFEEWGFVQLGEMLHYMHGYRMDSDATEKLVRLAVRYDVPVHVHLGTYWLKTHTGAVDGMDHMRDLLRAADRVPEAKYVLAHAIGRGPTSEYISWANMFLDTIQGVFPKYPGNFWIEIRDFHAAALPRAIREVPATRLLSGTDWTTRIGPPFQPYGTMFDVPAGKNPFPPKVESFVGFLRAAGASEAVITRIGSENAKELYRIPA